MWYEVSSGMYLFIIPLLLGFTFNAASALTAAYSRRWGEKEGSRVTLVLRDILGIPVWATGFLMAVRAPSPRLFMKTGVSQAAGLMLVGAGALIILLALSAIRSRAAAPSTRDHLVRTGLYGRMRHPIHSGTLLELAGLLLLSPTRAVAIACTLGFVWVLVQTGLEEYDLRQRLPDYRDYMNEVPRFLPRLRPKRS